jgi:hypothetical protein
LAFLALRGSVLALCLLLFDTLLLHLLSILQRGEREEEDGDDCVISWCTKGDQSIRTDGRRTGKDISVSNY